MSTRDQIAALAQSITALAQAIQNLITRLDAAEDPQLTALNTQIESMTGQVNAIAQG